MASVQFEAGKHTTKQACSGNIPHDFRERDNYANSDIDKSRTHLNQVFGCETGDEAREKLRRRIAECDALHPPKRLKEDRKTSLEICVPAPREELDDTKLRAFYEHVYSMFEDLFGKENVIYGVSHFDEIHEYVDPKTREKHLSRAGLHVVVVPFTDDQTWLQDKQKTGLNMNNFYRRNLPRMVNSYLNAICKEHFGFGYTDGTYASNNETVEQLKRMSDEAKKLCDTIEQQNVEIEQNNQAIQQQKEQMDTMLSDERQLLEDKMHDTDVLNANLRRKLKDVEDEKSRLIKSNQDSIIATDAMTGKFNNKIANMNQSKYDAGFIEFLKSKKFKDNTTAFDRFAKYENEYRESLKTQKIESVDDVEIEVKQSHKKDDSNVEKSDDKIVKSNTSETRAQMQMDFQEQMRRIQSAESYDDLDDIDFKF